MLIKLIIAIPYIKNPELNENFAPFFKKQWVNAFSHSLHNFFSNVFSKMGTTLPHPPALASLRSMLTQM